MNILKVLFLVVTGGAMLLGVELSEHVHSTRWKVKTLADSFVIDSPAISTTIEDQLALPSPRVDEDVPRLSSERTLYTLTAQLVQVKKEFDGDYHLVLEDPRTKVRMVAEIPDTTSLAPQAIRTEYEDARETIASLLGSKPGLFAVRPKTPLLIQVTGLGFFDEPHMITPTGMAQNGREIHPVLSVKPCNPISDR